MVKFLKTRDVKSPERKLGNVGFDFFIPNFNEVFERDFKAKNPTLNIEKPDATHADYYIRIPPHVAINVPSGIHSFLAPDEALIASNKSGIAIKKNLIRGAELIDPNYQGEIHLHLINVSNDFKEVMLGDKLVQFIPFKFDNETEITVEGPMRTLDLPHDDFDAKILSNEFYTNFGFSNRGAGMAGSTGTR
jgi:dUTPase